MALNARDIPVTRETVHQWLHEYAVLDPQPPIKDYIAGKLNDLNLPDPMVNTSEHEDLEDQTSLLTMILNDLPSYGI